MRESEGFFHPPAGHRPPSTSRRCRFSPAQGPDPNFQSHFTWPGPLNGCTALRVCWGSWSRGAEPALAKPTLRFRSDWCCLTQHNHSSPWTAGEGKWSLERMEVCLLSGKRAQEHQRARNLQLPNTTNTWSRTGKLTEAENKLDYCFLRRRGSWENYGAKEWE